MDSWQRRHQRQSNGQQSWGWDGTIRLIEYRILCLQFQNAGKPSNPLRAIMERILSFRFSIPNTRSIRPVYGDNHCCTFTQPRLLLPSGINSCIQVAWGPLSFLTAYLILTSHPLRHPLQIIVSLGQMYGDILYYGTSLFDHHVANISYCRPEAFYFYVYFIGMNAPWILIPAMLIWSSMRYIGKAVTRLQEAEREGKKNI